jgi:diphosphomevalonate decarboxylase
MGKHVTGFSTDTFKALIVNNATLSNVQKFHYLIASLKNKARDLLRNLQITNDNFLLAWQLVTQRYNNKRFIAMKYAKHLCQMPQANKGDASSLRQLINHVSSHVNAIQALSVNTPVQDLMLNHLMTSTLDNETLQQWEQLTTARLDLPTTAELITFLEARCRTFELIQNVQSIRMTTASPRTQQATGSKVSKSYCNVANPSQCTLCNEPHKLLKCEIFHKLQPRQRLTHVKQHRLCFNCLQPFVKLHPCSQQ